MNCPEPCNRREQRSGNGSDVFRLRASPALSDLNRQVKLPGKRNIRVNKAGSAVESCKEIEVTKIFESRMLITGDALISFAASETGLYRFTVQKVSLPGREYDRSLNIETSDTTVIP